VGSLPPPVASLQRFRTVAPFFPRASPPEAEFLGRKRRAAGGAVASRVNWEARAASAWLGLGELMRPNSTVALSFSREKVMAGISNMRLLLTGLAGWWVVPGRSRCFPFIVSAC